VCVCQISPDLCACCDVSLNQRQSPYGPYERPQPSQAGLLAGMANLLDVGLGVAALSGVAACLWCSAGGETAAGAPGTAEQQQEAAAGGACDKVADAHGITAPVALNDSSIEHPKSTPPADKAVAPRSALAPEVGHGSGAAVDLAAMCQPSTSATRPSSIGIASPRPLLLGVCGVSCAGKSTIASGLAQALTNDPAVCSPCQLLASALAPTRRL
jgi:hypothetical protein